MHYEQESGKKVTSLRNCFPKAFLASGLSIEITAIPAQNTHTQKILEIKPTIGSSAINLSE